MNLQNTGYCKTGLGKGSAECAVCQFECKARILSGGPGIEQALAEAGNVAPSGPVLLIPDSVKTLEALSDFIQSQGFKRGTDEYMNFYRQYREGLKSKYEYLNR